MFKNGEQIALSARIFDLLLVMVQNEGRILEHEELLDKIWGETFVEQSNLKKSVSALRHILGEQANESLYVKTVPRRGYAFVSPVRAIEDDAPAATATAAAVYRETETEVIVEEIIEIEDEREFEQAHAHTENEVIDVRPHRALPQRTSAESPKSFLTTLKKHRLAVAAVCVLLILTAGFFAVRSFRASAPTANYSVENVRARRLTTEGNLGNAAPISPDGKYIIYPVYFGEQGSLWLRQVETGSVARLTPVMAAQYWAYEFSPDGNYVYYIINRSDTPAESGLFRIPTLGGNPQKLIDRANGGLSFAPDGSRFAFSRVMEEGGRIEVVSAEADGGDLRRAFVVPENKTLWSLKWSPDNHNLLYSVRERGENKLYGYVAETPWDNEGDVPAETIVFPKQDSQAVINASWLPDKSSLLISLREPNADICQLWQYLPVKGEKRRITNDDNSYRVISLTRDGRGISTVQENWKSEIWIADNASALDFHPSAGAKNSGVTFWTKDTKLIYEGFENQQATVWLADLESGARRQLTQGTDGIYTYPSLSQAGDSITFVSNRSGSSQIWRVNLDGTGVRQLTTSTSFAGWRSKLLADGQTLIYMTQTPQTGWRLVKQTADGKTSFLTDAKTDYWAISPDEKLLAAVLEDEKTKKYRTFVKNLETGETIKTLDINVTRQISWTRDSRALAYIVARPDMDELVLQPLDDTAPKVLSATRGERISSFDWSFDGAKLLVVRSRYAADAFLIKAQEN